MWSISRNYILLRLSNVTFLFFLIGSIATTVLVVYARFIASCILSSFFGFFVFFLLLVFVCSREHFSYLYPSHIRFAVSVCFGWQTQYNGVPIYLSYDFTSWTKERPKNLILEPKTDTKTKRSFRYKQYACMNSSQELPGWHNTEYVEI